MRKPISSKITRLNSRSNLVRLLQWNLRRDMLAEIGPLQYQLDQLQDTIRDLSDLMHRRTSSIMESCRETNLIRSKDIETFHEDSRKFIIAFGTAIAILFLGYLIVFLVN